VEPNEETENRHSTDDSRFDLSRHLLTETILLSAGLLFRSASAGNYLPQLMASQYNVAMGAQNTSYATEVVEKSK
jgi:hypothetical protein